jgi:hypothetical protein
MPLIIIQLLIKKTFVAEEVVATKLLQALQEQNSEAR